MARTVLIGLDGGTFRIFDALMARGVMPFLAGFVRNGVRADLLSTANPLTPPAWTSLMTGRTPGHHGIFDFLRVEEKNDDLFFTLHDFRDIRCETIWSVASRAGRRVTVLNFPLTAPPEPIRGAIVPGLVSWKHLRRNTHPSTLFETLKTLPGFDAKEMSWDFDLETRAVKAVPPEEYADWIRFHIRRERQWFSIVRHMMEKEPSDLTAILFDGTDKLQHLCWRFLDPESFPAAPSEWERSIQELCLDYFRQLDRFLAEIARMAGPEARLFMASDHGFGPTVRVFRVNAWLRQQGFLAWRTFDPSDAEARARVEQRLKSDVAFVDLNTTTAYARTSASNGIAIRVAREGRPGVPLAEYAAFRERLTRLLLDVREPDTGEKVVVRATPREEAFPGPLSGRAPDLTLSLADGGFVSIGDKEPVVQRRPEVAGTHRPEGIFIAGGPGIAKGAALAPRAIVDVASTLLYSLGVPIPEDLEGRLPLEAFEPALLRETPPRTGPPTEPVRSPDAQAGQSATPGYDAAEEALIADRLKVLGYLE